MASAADESVPSGGTDVEDRLRAFDSVTDLASLPLDVDDLLSDLLTHVGALMAVDTAAVLLVDKDAEQLIARAAWGIEEEVRQGVRLSIGHGFAGRIAATRQPVTLDRVGPDTVANPLLWEKGIRAMLGVPLLIDDDVLGVLHVGSLTDRHFDRSDSDLLVRVAARVAPAVRDRAFEVERSTSRVLQRSLLPAALPRCEGVEFAARYVPAEVGGVGGDWYDAFVLPGGDLWVMIGDVVGHGMHAAIVMGRLRSTLRAYAFEGFGPDEVLTRADRKLQFFEPGETVTVLCARIRPPYEVMSLALAGHPPPVLASPGARSGLVHVEPGLPLGVDVEVARATDAVPLPAGAVVLAYTDGLIERRDRSLDSGLELLCSSVEAKEPDAVCVKVMDQLVGNVAPMDDIAVLAVRRTPSAHAHQRPWARPRPGTPPR